ncbi:MAG: glycosyltransferase [Actinomycetota bacterium]|nr:glycosyltransferase [Actinomycetota bacterium]
MTDGSPVPADLGAVMAVYGGVAPDHLRRALASLVEQTRPADDVVVVEDGPLGPALSGVLDRAERELPLRRVVLPTNRGAGPARQAGLRELTSRWVAVADADDVSLPRRFAVQLAWLEESGDTAVGAAMAEFEGAEENVTGVRRLPSEHDEIARLLTMNNPVNHPTLIVDRRQALAVGGYPDLPYLEAYDLIARLVASGARMHNLPDVLVRFRAGAVQLRRRRSKGVLGSELTLQRNLRRYGLIGRPTAARNVVLRTAYRTVPAPLRHRIYGRLFLRRRP